MRRTVPVFFASFAVLILFTSGVRAQNGSGFQEVYTGTIVSMNGPMRSTTFNLSIRSFTDDAEAQRLLGILGEGNQDDLLRAIRNNDLGRISTAGSVGRNLIVARRNELPDGRIQIVAAFERWQTIREIRSGSRIQDYPFGVMEIFLDSGGRTGSGTFVAAGRVRLRQRDGKSQLELENFGTYPNRVMGVSRRN